MRGETSEVRSLQLGQNWVSSRIFFFLHEDTLGASLPHCLCCKTCGRTSSQELKSNLMEIIPAGAPSIATQLRACSSQKRLLILGSPAKPCKYFPVSTPLRNPTTQHSYSANTIVLRKFYPHRLGVLFCCCCFFWFFFWVLFFFGSV